MRIFDLDELKSFHRDRDEVTRWCIEATKEFFGTAKELKTIPFTRDCKYSYGPLTNKRNVTKTIPQFPFKIQIVEFYVIILSSNSTRHIVNEEFSASVALKDGSLYFNGHKSDACEIGMFIADVCSYDQEIAKELFKSALHGEPWDVAYAIERSEKNRDPRISIDGDNNIVGGRDVTKF